MCTQKLIGMYKSYYSLLLGTNRQIKEQSSEGSRSPLGMRNSKEALNARLASVDIPQCVIGCSYACNNIDHNSAVDKYYADIVRELH